MFAAIGNDRDASIRCDGVGKQWRRCNENIGTLGEALLFLHKVRTRAGKSSDVVDAIVNEGVAR